MTHSADARTTAAASLDPVAEQSGGTDGQSSVASAPMATGAPLRGRLSPIAGEDVPPELRAVTPADAMLLPAGLEESVGKSGQEYAFDSASGLDFPREHLDDGFFERIKIRYKRDKEAGQLGKFDLVINEPNTDVRP